MSIWLTSVSSSGSDALAASVIRLTVVCAPQATKQDLVVHCVGCFCKSKTSRAHNNPCRWTGHVSKAARADGGQGFAGDRAERRRYRVAAAAGAGARGQPHRAGACQPRPPGFHGQPQFMLCSHALDC